MSDHYNEAPEGLKEISPDSWQHGMFLYCLGESSQRQVRGAQVGKPSYDLLLFPLAYPSAMEKKLGYAIKHEFFNHETGKLLPTDQRRMVFCRYGNDDDWTKFQNKFAAQFSRDNS